MNVSFSECPPQVLTDDEIDQAEDIVQWIEVMKGIIAGVGILANLASLASAFVTCDQCDQMVRFFCSIFIWPVAITKIIRQQQIAKKDQKFAHILQRFSKISQNLVTLHTMHVGLCLTHRQSLSTQTYFLFLSKNVIFNLFKQHNSIKNVQQDLNSVCQRRRDKHSPPQPMSYVL